MAHTNPSSVSTPQSMEAVMQRRYEELELLYRTAPVGLAFLDTELRFVRINDRLAAMDGPSVQDHIGRRLREVLPSMAPKLEPVLREVLDGREPVLALELSGVTPAAPETEKHWLASYHPMADEGGDVIGVSAVVQEITDLKRKERALGERVRFERLLSELSATFVKLPSADVDERIETGLQLFGEVMGADRLSLLQFSEDSSVLRISHIWHAQGIEPDEKSPGYLLSDRYPWLTTRMREREVVRISHREECPPEAEAERRYMEAAGIQEFVMVPLVAGGRTLGGIVLDAVRQGPWWQEDGLRRVHLLGEVFANALERRRADAELEQLRGFERLVSDISADFLRVSPDGVDAAIEEALQRVGEYLETDLGTVLLLDGEEDCFTVSHQWLGPNIRRDPRWLGTPVGGALPWLKRQLAQNKPFLISNLAKWPDVATRERALCEMVGIRSVLWVPFGEHRGITGYVALNTTRQERTWTDDFVQRLRVVGEVFASALMRRRSERELAERLKFEELLSELSATFVGLSPDEVDGHMLQSLQRTLELVGGDRCSLLEFSEEAGLIQAVHCYARPGVEAVMTILRRADFPWLFEQVLRGQALVFSELDDLPDPWAVDAAGLRCRGTVSFVFVALPAGDASNFALLLETVGRVLVWPTPLVQRLRVVGEMLVNAVVRRRSAEQLRAARLEAEEHRHRLAHLARLHLVSEMTAGIAHEINQPLAAIESYAQAGQKRLQTNTASLAKLQELLTKISAQARRAGGILSRVRAMVSRRPIERAPADIDLLIRESVGIVANEASLRGMEIALELAPNTPPVDIDSIQIQQVMVNLLQNAVESMQEAGLTEPAVITVGTRPDPPNGVEVSVADTGPGIPAADAGHVFEPFHSSKSSGLGIGLAVCRNIIDSHGGRIWFSRNPQGGVTFHFTLARDAEDRKGR